MVDFSVITGRRITWYRRSSFTVVAALIAAPRTIFFTAPTVTTTLSKLIRLTGSISRLLTTATRGRLRADSSMFRLSSSRTSSASTTSSPSRVPARSRVFGASMEKSSTTIRRPWRFSSDRMERIAARYILRFTFWEKSRVVTPKVTPPPRKIGLRMVPARERPVPFWRQGLAPPPATWERFFRPLVPARAPAR